MPRKLDSCVRKVMAQGKSKSSAYAICVVSTGWQRGKKRKWVKRKRRKRK